MIKTINATALLFCITVICANAQDVNKRLDGTWKLDSVQIVKISDNSVVEFNKFKQNPYFGLFDALEFQGSDLTITENDFQTTDSVQITENKIIIPFTSAPIEFQYRIVDEQLLLEHHVSYSGETHPDNDFYIVKIKYKRQ